MPLNMLLSGVARVFTTAMIRSRCRLAFAYPW
jgi:hypothetical protein